MTYISKQKVENSCEECHNKFLTSQPQAKFCSEICRKKSWKRSNKSRLKSVSPRDGKWGCYYNQKNSAGIKRSSGQECEGTTHLFVGTFSKTPVELCDFHFKEVMEIEKQLIRSSTQYIIEHKLQISEVTVANFNIERSKDTV